MANLESLRRCGLVLEMAEAAGDGDLAAWTKVVGSLYDVSRADLVRQSSLGIAMVCECEAVRGVITLE